MVKQDLFSKFNIKDYNNELEKVLETKNFSEGTKNILLNILYKIEVAYDDYVTVKVGTRSKKEILEEITNVIRNDCEVIELVKPKTDNKTELKDKTFKIEYKNKKIISYPNEKKVYYALCNLLANNIIINKEYGILKRPIEKLLNAGYIMDLEEIIRDFDGWSWNITTNEIENYIYNIVYQNIKILIDEKYLLENINQYPIINFLGKFEKRLREIYNEELANELISNIYQIAILEYIHNDKKEQEKMLLKKNKLNEDINRMENKKVYLQKLANKKKDIGKQIKKIDEMMNDTNLLKEEFIKHNEGMNEDEKVFSLSQYSEIIQNERENLLLKLREYSSLMKPMNYIKMKSEFKNVLKIIDKIDFESDINKQIDELIIILQINFLKALNDKIEKTKLKKLIINYIYLFRYYKSLRIKNDTKIEDIKDLKKELIKTEKFLITRACNLKIMNIIFNNIERNYEIISKILSFNIIDLEKVQIKFKLKGNKIEIEVYDDDIIENIFEYETKEKLNVKLNKKIKLFI